MLRYTHDKAPFTESRIALADAAFLLVTLSLFGFLAIIPLTEVVKAHYTNTIKKSQHIVFINKY